MKTATGMLRFFNLNIMKKNIVLGLLSALVLLACKKETAVEDFKIEPAVNPFSEVCYLGVKNKDTVSMSLIIKGDTLQYGKLSYKYFEKDFSEGSLVGAFHGDTLLGQYSFQSEGVKSVREVIFLKQGKSYIEGFGPVTENQGKVVFQNLKAIQFNDAIPLLEVPCSN